MANEQNETSGKLSSFIGDLPDVISKFWKGVARPLLELALTLVAISFALGWDSDVARDSSQLMPGAENTAEFLDIYGLRALIPMATLVILLGIAQANSAAMRMLGSLVVGRITADTDALVLKKADIEQLMRVRAQYPKLNLTQVSERVDEEIASATAASKSRLLDARELLEKINFYSGASNFVKGLVVTVLVVASLSSIFDMPGQIQIGRIALVAACAVVALSDLAIVRMRLTKEFTRRKIADYLAHLEVTKRGNLLEPTPEIVSETTSALANLKDTNCWQLKWWRTEGREELRELSRLVFPSYAGPPEDGPQGAAIRNQAEPR